MKPEQIREIVLKHLVGRETQVALAHLMKALHSFMYVIASTETEAFKLWSERAETDRLKEHWKGRQEAAWSIRRHCFDEAEKAMKLLEKIVPEGAWGKRGQKELRERIKRAKETAKKTHALRKKAGVEE